LQISTGFAEGLIQSQRTDYRWEYALVKAVPLARETAAPFWAALHFVQ